MSSLVVRESSNATQAAQQQLVGPVLDPSRDGGVSGSSGRRVVFEATVLGWIVRRRDDDAVRQIGRAAAVVRQDRMRDGRRWRVAVGSINCTLDTVPGEHFEGRLKGRVGKRVRVLADIKRTGDLLRCPVFTYRLRDGQDMRLIESAAKRRPSVTARAEANALLAIVGVWRTRVVLVAKSIDINKRVLPSVRAGQRVHPHQSL